MNKKIHEQDIALLLDAIEKRWRRRSDKEEEAGGEGWVDFDKQLKDVEWAIKKVHSRTIELMEEDYQLGYIRGTKRMLTDKDNAYEIGMEDAKADFRKIIEEELRESNEMLKKNPLNDYWLGREIVLQKILAKLGDDKEDKK